MVMTWRPTKRSPVYHKLVQQGAVLGDVSRWLVAQHFTTPSQEVAATRFSVGVADLSFLTKWELKGTGVAELLASLTHGVPPEPGRLRAADFGYAARLSAPHAMLVLKEENPALAARLKTEAARGDCLHALERTSGLGAFLLCGPSAPRLLGRLTSLDLRPARFADLACTCGPLAATPVTLVRRDRLSLPAFEIFFQAEYGEYLWDCLMEAGSDFALRPIGVSATRLLGGEEP